MYFLNRLLFKIIFFVVILFTFSIALYLTFYIQNQLEKARETIRHNGIIFAELSAPVLYQDYLMSSGRGVPTFEDIIKERLKKNIDVAQVMLVATTGKIIFDSQELLNSSISSKTVTAEKFIQDRTTEQLLQNSTTQFRDITIDGKKFTEIIIPIDENGGGHVFSMRYVLSYNSLAQRTTEIYHDTILALLPLLFLTIGSGIVLAYSITKPIERLSHATERIVQGDLTVEIPIKSQDEIGRLTQGFNQMVRTLAGSQKSAKEYSKSLETQVTQRTQELQTKVAELERMNKLMLGRELKMAELKKMIPKTNQSEKTGV